MLFLGEDKDKEDPIKDFLVFVTVMDFSHKWRRLVAAG